jgi:hypothetical protein
MSDITLKCVEKDCGQEFTFSESEQKFYAEKQLQQPKRCKACRERRKQEKLSQGS